MKVLVRFPGWRAVADGGRRAYPPGTGDNAALATWRQMSSLEIFTGVHIFMQVRNLRVQTHSSPTCVEGLVTGSPALVRVTVICTCWLGIPPVWGGNLPPRPGIPVWRPASLHLPAPSPPSGQGRINTACLQCPEPSRCRDGRGHYQDVLMLGLKLLLNLPGTSNFLCFPNWISKEYMDVVYLISHDVSA